MKFGSLKSPLSADGELYENLLLHLKRTFVKKQTYVVNINPVMEGV